MLHYGFDRFHSENKAYNKWQMVRILDDSISLLGNTAEHIADTNSYEQLKNTMIKLGYNKNTIIEVLNDEYDKTYLEKMITDIIKEFNKKMIDVKLIIRHKANQKKIEDEKNIIDIIMNNNKPTELLPHHL